MADSVASAGCLGCGKQFRLPTRLVSMAERYHDGRLVLFCNRSCNLKFVEKIGKQGQEDQMRELIDRLENTDA